MRLTEMPGDAETTETEKTVRAGLPLVTAVLAIFLCIGAIVGVDHVIFTQTVDNKDRALRETLTGKDSPFMSREVSDRNWKQNERDLEQLRQQIRDLQTQLERINRERAQHDVDDARRFEEMERQLIRLSVRSPATK